MVDFTQQEAYLLGSTDAAVRRRAAIAALYAAAAAGKNVFVTDPGGKISGVAAAAAPSLSNTAATETAENGIAVAENAEIEAVESAAIAAAVGENAALAAQGDSTAESADTAAETAEKTMVSAAPEGAAAAGKAAAPAVTFWDVYASRGLALRTTASELGPYLMAMLLELTDAQTELLQVLYQIADDNGLLLIDTKDLRALINEVTENSESYEKTYGKVNGASASAILKAITLLEGRGGKDFLFEPAIDVRDFVGKGEPVAAAAQVENTADAAAENAANTAPAADAAPAAVGVASAGTAEGSCSAPAAPRIHILDAQDLSADEGLYRVMLLYLLSECAENAESADLSSLVLIIDDAGIVLGAKDKTFAGKMRSVLSRLTEREITVIFLAENETDVPEEIRKRLLCEPAEDTAEGTEDTKAITLALRKEILAADPLAEKYKVPFERDSAYEFLLRRGLKAEEAAAVTQAREEGNSSASPGSASPATDAAAVTVGAAGTDTQTEAGTAGTAADTQTGAADTASEAGAAGAAADTQTGAAGAIGTASEEEAAAGTSAGAASDSADSAKKTDSAETSEKAAKMAKRAKSSAQSLGTTVAGTVGRKIGKSIGENFGSFGSTLGANVGASIGRGIMKTFFGE